MKVLFTADWHIKLGQKNVPKDWQINRFHSLVDNLINIDCDIIVIGGDIFDKLPNLEELSLYFDLIKKFNKPTYIFDGNHEAGKRGYTWLSKLNEVTSSINDYVAILNENCTELLGIDIIPYTRLKTFNSRDYKNKILFTHVRGSIPPFVHPEIDLSLFSRWDLVLAGDLHDHSATLEEENKKYNIVYPGSPMTVSFHRNKVNTGVILLDTDSLSWEFIKLDLPQLLRKTISNMNEAIPTDFDHTIYEITGNVEDLSNISTNDLVDRKVVKSNKESELELEGMSLEQEVDLYLRKVLKIEDTSEILGVLNDHIT